MTREFLRHVARRAPSMGLTSVTATSSGLWEREGESAAIATAVKAVGAGRGGLLLVRGPAGIGKTRLLGEVHAQAMEINVLRSRARAVELEQGIAFGVVRQLFEPLLTAARPRGYSGAIPPFRSPSPSDTPCGRAPRCCSARTCCTTTRVGGTGLSGSMPNAGWAPVRRTRPMATCPSAPAHECVWVCISVN